MGLTLKSVSQYISGLQQGIIAALAGNAPDQQVSDFSAGTLAGAFTESAGIQLAFVQSQAPAVLAVTRASTSSLPDLITFVQDFNLSPPWLGPTFNSGTAVFRRNQAASAAVVLLVGTLVQNAVPSPSSAVQYAVIADPTNLAYSVNAGGTGVGGYTLTAGLLQFAQNPRIQAVLSGTPSAVIATTLKVIASPGVPFDSVTNPLDIANGSDGETAPQLRQRFSDYISSRSGTRFQIAARVAGVQAGLSFTLNEYTNTDGTPRDGFTTVVVDDGSGAPSALLLSAITAAIVDPMVGKSLGAQVVPIAATLVPVTIAVSGTTIKSGFASGDVRAAIHDAVIAYVNANGVGGAPVGTGSGAASGKLSYAGILNVVGAFIGTVPGQGLAGYAAITVNGAAADIPLTSFQLARASSGGVVVS